ncbi:hypothetical protein [Salidesulfovibrio onnuriiensis]|uniref:hypothetical protein n=1 Tax=Salidesulfovibrio onnuriiensis TaxID=2583823 RepID=UPI0011CC8876|nr:hypothetical protein [Salidesulfovibrio onnuriiensis]
MKSLNNIILALAVLLLFAGTVHAGNSPSEDEPIVVTGFVFEEQDGFYLDDGNRTYRLVGMDDPNYSGLMTEVRGNYFMMEDQPAIQVGDMVVIEEAMGAEDQEEIPSADDGY